MTIAWAYLDKKGAAREVLKDYPSMAFILEKIPEGMEVEEARLLAVRASVPNGLPSAHNPQACERRIAAAIDEIDVLKERYRQALEYMEWFQPAWNALSGDEQYVLGQFFFTDERHQQDALAEVSRHFTIERSSAYKKKNRALARFTLLLYGK